MAGVVLVTGGSGYIAGFAIRQLVAEGWTVRATIRSLLREAEIRKALAVDDAKVSFFAADLTSDAGWAEAMAGCSHLLHMASPFPPTAPKHEDELIIPARDGALRALRFARDAGVKRVVMTSSVAAMFYGYAKGDQIFDESHWTKADDPHTYAYAKSKTIAELAARDWIAAEGGALEFCTINPSLVLGPVLGADFSSSIDAVKKLLAGEFPGIPDLGFAVVDVRDVADLHIRALTAPGMNGERFAAAGRFMKLSEIAQILKDRLGRDARKVPTRKLPDWLMRIVARFDPVARQVIGELGNIRRVDSSHAKAVLGWQTRPEEQTIEDTARSLIALGVVKV